jgi:hypothetical protein
MNSAIVESTALRIANSLTFCVLYISHLLPVFHSLFPGFFYSLYPLLSLYFLSISNFPSPFSLFFFLFFPFFSPLFNIKSIILNGLHHLDTLFRLEQCPLRRGLMWTTGKTRPQTGHPPTPRLGGGGGGGIPRIFLIRIKNDVRRLGCRVQAAKISA